MKYASNRAEPAAMYPRWPDPGSSHTTSEITCRSDFFWTSHSTSKNPRRPTSRSTDKATSCSSSTGGRPGFARARGSGSPTSRAILAVDIITRVCGVMRPWCGLRLLFLLAAWRCPATTALPGHALKAKTCNDTADGTTGQLLLSFCDGGAFCTTGQENVYNSNEELEAVGAWNTLEVPLEYEPTTMLMTLVGSDAWCIEELMWDNGPDMLGNGGRIYLDGNLGETGCNYGVHTSTGWFYPCQSSWRFFNLPDSDDYKYEVRVKPCQETVTTSDSTQRSSPTIQCSLCAESQCDTAVGEVVSFNLTLATAGGGSNGAPSTTSINGWSTTLAPAGFNPVAMKLTNLGEYPWCAEEITFNGFTLVNPDVSPKGMKLGMGDDRRFFNLQALGVWEESDSGLSQENDGSELEDKAWDVAAEVITAVVVFSATVAFTSFVRRCLKPAASREQEQDEKSCDEGTEGDGGDGGDDVGEADVVPLCNTCQCVHHGQTVELRRLSSGGKKTVEPLLGDDSCARSVTSTLDRVHQPRDSRGKLTRYNSDEWGDHYDQKRVSGRMSSKMSQEDNIDSPPFMARSSSVTGDGPGLFFYEGREPERASDVRGREGRHRWNSTALLSPTRATSAETVVEDYGTQQNTPLPV